MRIYKLYKNSTAGRETNQQFKISSDMLRVKSMLNLKPQNENNN